MGKVVMVSKSKLGLPPPPYLAAAAISLETKLYPSASCGDIGRGVGNVM